MTAAHEQRISDRCRLRLQSLCEGVRKGKRLRDNPKRKDQWQKIVTEINSADSVEWNVYYAQTVNNNTRYFNSDARAKALAHMWQKDCQSVGIGVGLLSWFFWNFFMPILIQLAKDWLEEMQTEVISGVAMGSAEGSSRG